MEGFDFDSFIADLAAANECERLANDLDRRGGGFTAHASALARQRADQLGGRLDRARARFERSGSYEDLCVLEKVERRVERAC